MDQALSQLSHTDTERKIHNINYYWLRGKCTSLYMSALSCICKVLVDGTLKLELLKKNYWNLGRIEPGTLDLGSQHLPL